MSVSIIIPAKNESRGLENILPLIKSTCPDCELILVDDGSDDDTSEVGTRHGAQVIRHPISMGNGAAIKTGAKAANGSILVFMDADGQHNPSDIHRLTERLNDGYDMAVGAREPGTHASLSRRIGNGLYNRLASWITEHEILDLTSGFRAVRADKFRQFLCLLPNKFSYPTTITMAFIRSAYPVAYVPIEAARRVGKSHINLVADGYRFLIIIFKVATLFSPLKIFVPASLLFLILGVSYYVYTYLSASTFTNMGVLLMITSILIFLIGLVSEQITTLMYQTQSSYRDNDTNQ